MTGKVKPTGKSVFNLAAALIVPCLAIGLLDVAMRTTRVQIHDSWLAFNLCAAAGFVFLVREFRFYALPLAVVYFPLMYLVMLGFALFFAGLVYGEFL